MYDILELNKMLLPELREIAKNLKIKRVESFRKPDLIYRILDEQAIAAAEKKHSGVPASESYPRHDHKNQIKRGRKPYIKDRPEVRTEDKREDRREYKREDRKEVRREESTENLIDDKEFISIPPPTDIPVDENPILTLSLDEEAVTLEEKTISDDNNQETLERPAVIEKEPQEHYQRHERRQVDKTFEFEGIISAFGVLEI